MSTQVVLDALRRADLPEPAVVETNLTAKAWTETGKGPERSVPAIKFVSDGAVVLWALRAQVLNCPDVVVERLAKRLKSGRQMTLDEFLKTLTPELRDDLARGTPTGEIAL